MMHQFGKCAISTQAWVLAFIPRPVRNIKQLCGNCTFPHTPFLHELCLGHGIKSVTFCHRQGVEVQFCVLFSTLLLSPPPSLLHLSIASISTTEIALHHKQERYHDRANVTVFTVHYVVKQTEFHLASTIITKICSLGYVIFLSWPALLGVQASRRINSMRRQAKSVNNGVRGIDFISFHSGECGKHIDVIFVDISNIPMMQASFYIEMAPRTEYGTSLSTPGYRVIYTMYDDLDVTWLTSHQAIDNRFKSVPIPQISME